MNGISVLSEEMIGKTDRRNGHALMGIISIPSEAMIGRTDRRNGDALMGRSFRSEAMICRTD
jgi:hypothetical protein